MNLLKQIVSLALLAITLLTSAAVYAADATVDALTVDVAVTKNKADNNSAKIESTQAGAKATQDALQAEMANRVAADEALANSITNISLTPGPQGVQGIQGLAGDQGIQGLTGATGAKGDQGIQGLTGDQGIPGLKGETGVQGDQGLPGSTGAVGPQGIAGNDGAPGVNGLAGAKGADGAQGSAGANGINGVDSTIPGPPGIQGPAGAGGLGGAKGDTGPQGIQGATGPAGSQGDPGPAVTADEKLYAVNDIGPSGVGIVIYVTHDGKHGIEMQRLDSTWYETIGSGSVNGETYKAPWGCLGTGFYLNSSKNKGVGSGKANTDEIMDTCPGSTTQCAGYSLSPSLFDLITVTEPITLWETCETYPANLPFAALLASSSAAGWGANNVQYGGYWDWYLPNLVELALAYKAFRIAPPIYSGGRTVWTGFQDWTGDGWYWSSQTWDSGVSTDGAMARCMKGDGCTNPNALGGEVGRRNRTVSGTGSWAHVRSVRHF